jgi:4-hydroxybenzoate polyprenyltransferase
MKENPRLIQWVAGNINDTERGTGYSQLSLGWLAFLSFNPPYLCLKEYTLKPLDFLINTNIFISLSAVALTVETQVQLGMQPQLHPYLFIIFFATLFEYNLHRLVTIITRPELLDDEKHRWVKNHLKLFYALVAFTVICFLGALLLAKLQVIITLAPIAAITIFYSLPIFKAERRLFRLREIPALKIFLIALVWSIATIMLPIIQSGKPFETKHVLLMLTERFLFVFAITIPFDIRDINADQKGGLKTLPTILGERRALRLANISLTIFMLVCILHYRKPGLIYLMPAFIISAASSYYFLNNAKLKTYRLYHYAVLDGTLMLQGVLACICYYVSLFYQ